MNTYTCKLVAGDYLLLVTCLDNPAATLDAIAERLSCSLGAAVRRWAKLSKAGHVVYYRRLGRTPAARVVTRSGAVAAWAFADELAAALSQNQSVGS